MGILVPFDLSINKLKGAEARVVQLLADGLSDGWFVIPRLDITAPRRPYEVDVLLIHPGYGILAVEIKGGPFEIREGEWYRRGELVGPPPPRQAQDAAYELRKRLREADKRLRRVHVEHAVALPDLVDFDGQLPIGVIPEQLFFADDLDAPLAGVQALMTRRGANQSLDEEQLAAVMAVVRPNVDFQWNPEAHHGFNRRTLQRISSEQTRALTSLDVNRRVVVTGRAGSGKTRLAVAWAGRAFRRGERTLLTCYNRPIADWLKERAPDTELLRIDSIQGTVMNLAGLPELPVPEGADQRWWDTVPFEHLEQNLGLVEERFDTVIVDEAQDFSPHWLDTIEQLLADDGPQRVLMLCDPGQGVYERGFVLPEPGPDLVRADLGVNCRNSQAVASLLTELGGASPAPGAPEGTPVTLIAVESGSKAVEEAQRAVQHLLEDLMIDSSNVLVLTGHREMRDRIRNGTPDGTFVPWEERQSGAVICETIHRSKGLERDAVVVATEDKDLPDHLLYVGLSRAVSHLAVVAPQELLDRMVEQHG